MIAIAVDDEPLMLGALTKAIKASEDITFVADFTSCEDALNYVKSNPADIAFLDINMRGMGGLALAEKIIGFCPDCKIVFCTGYEEYAISAFKLHASGYLMKPVSAKDIQTEIDNIKGIRQNDKPITVKCFGNFEVFTKGKKLTFKRSKTKELFSLAATRSPSSFTASVTVRDKLSKLSTEEMFPSKVPENRTTSFFMNFQVPVIIAALAGC